MLDVVAVVVLLSLHFVVGGSLELPNVLDVVAVVYSPVVDAPAKNKETISLFSLELDLVG